MSKVTKIANTFAGVKLTGAVVLTLFLAGFSFYKYVEAQKVDTTEQTITAIKPYLEQINAKLNKVILSQELSLQRDTLINNKIDRFKLQSTKDLKEQNRILREINSQVPYFINREVLKIDSLKKKLSNICQSEQLYR